MSKYKCTPDMILHGELPSDKNINRWREYVKRMSPHACTTIDSVFDLAIVGLDKAQTAEQLSRAMLRDSLRELARNVQVKRK